MRPFVVGWTICVAWGISSTLALPWTWPSQGTDRLSDFTGYFKEEIALQEQSFKIANWPWTRNDPPSDDDVGRNETLVPVTLGVMSKCSDAMACENVFGRVLDRTGHANITLSYITTPVSSSGRHLTCKHGETECQGNIQQLCFKKYYPVQRDWFAFVNCQNFNSKIIGTDAGIESCAKALRKDPEPVEKCARSSEGRELFLENALATRKAGIETSCTIIINGRQRCVIDGGKWRDCESLEGHDASAFVKAIDEEYQRLNG